MRLIDLKCPNCSSVMKVDSEEKEVMCEYCGTKFAVDDEVQHIQYDNAGQAGYEFEKGRQRAQSEQQYAYNYIPPQQAHQPAYTQPPKKKRTWLWVLGWICIFPVPLTILMVRNKTMNKWLRIGIIAAAWIIYLIIGFAGGVNDSDTTTVDGGAISESTSVTEQAEESFDGSNSIDEFVNKLNSNLDGEISFVEDFDVQDSSNPHYQHEFRLNAYKDAVGKDYSYNSASVDVVARKTFTNGAVIRLYAENASLEDCNNLIKASANLFDPDLTESEITEITDYMAENKSTNGYYKGDVGIVLLQKGKDKFELMIKGEGD